MTGGAGKWRTRDSRRCSPARSSLCSRKCFPGRSASRSPATLWRAACGRCETRDIREHGLGRHRAVDDTPAGGGPGMVMRADVLAASLDAAAPADDPRPRLIMSPRGAPLHASAGAPMGGGPGPRHRLPPLRGRRRARHRGTRPDRSVDRRLHPLRRRDRRARGARRLRAADPRRDGQARIRRPGEFRGGPARISPLHAPARMGGTRHSRRAAVGRPQGDREVAPRRKPSGSRESGGRISRTAGTINASSSSSLRAERSNPAIEVSPASRESIRRRLNRPLSRSLDRRASLAMTAEVRFAQSPETSSLRGAERRSNPCFRSQRAVHNDALARQRVGTGCSPR